jgi:TolB-like protein
VTAPDIFLSYNREDQAVAKRFAEGFEAQGLAVWWDVTLRSGEAYDRVTEEALRTAKAVVVLWSPRSVGSRWVRAEASIADENGTLIPAKIEACQLPVMFRLTQTADLSRWQGEMGDPAWAAFLGDVKRKVRAEAAHLSSIKTDDTSQSDARMGPPLVALLPFARRGNEATLDFLAEDLTQEVNRELSRNSFFKVIAAGSLSASHSGTTDYRALRQDHGAVYTVDGKLQRQGQQVRLTAQLVDTANGGVLKTARFVRIQEDIENAMEEFAADISSEMGDYIEQNEIDRALARSVAVSGWERCLRAVGNSRIASVGTNQTALQEARQAVEALPDLGLAHALLAWALAVPGGGFGVQFDEHTRQEILAHSLRAQTLDGNNPVVIGHLITAFAALGDHDTCLRIAERAVALSDNSTFAVGWLAIAYTGVGRFEEAIARSAEYERRSRGAYYSPVVLWNLAVTLYLVGRAADADAALDRSMAIHPNFVQSLKWKAITSASLGRPDVAIATLRRMREVEPSIGLDQHIQQMMFAPAMAPHMTEAVATLRRLWTETGAAP